MPEARTDEGHAAGNPYFSPLSLVAPALVSEAERLVFAEVVLAHLREGDRIDCFF